MKKRILTNAEILDGIKASDEHVADYIYESCFPQIRSFVKRNKGNTQEAYDVFQEAYIAIHLKIRNVNIKLNCEFGTYFYAFCKNIWFKELDRNKRHNTKIRVVSEQQEEYGDFTEEISKAEQYVLYLENFNKLIEKCRKLLKMYFDKFSFEEIASKLGFENANQARKKKYKCIKQLTRFIQEDVRYIDMKGGYHAK